MKIFFQQLLRYQKYLFLALTIVVAIIILFPIRTFQAPLAQGDHGRDLYAFWQTSQGATPYQDYWWCYGPLMPYYYGFIFKIFNPLIQIALLGELLLKLTAVILCYLALSCFVQAGWALIGALWLAAFMPHFPHTYNHAGGITALLWTILNLFLYLKSSDRKFLWLGFCSITITFLIKFNIGIYSLAGFLACAIFSDLVHENLKKNLRSYIYGLLLSCAFLMATHFWFVRGLPMYYILQCFPFLGGYRQIAPTTSLWANMLAFTKETFGQITSYKPYLAILIIVVDFLVFAILLFFSDKQRRAENKKALLGILAASIFFLFCLHEHLASPMIYSRYWTEPFQILFIFLIIGFMAPRTPKIFQVALIVFFCSVLFSRATLQRRFIAFFKDPLHHFHFKSHDMYATNAPDWFFTIYQTMSALERLPEQNETFFVLPYEPLYYFLAKKQSPVKELCFFDFMHIPIDQEKDIILNLEIKKVRYVLLSNRCNSPTEPSIGIFGKTYGILLSNYLARNFEVIESFGNWGRPVGWIDNHATRILKRKSFLIQQ
ncbi:MAG TPA: hypothetical protein PLO93_02195 [Candidatus Omnitrophota bacterium]|nr:hypothetical protein [Candidatus Omnitrophota bacterium]HQL41086.1 hypothetical protein [Candidatus Omnitrophota bacterium]